MPAGYKSRRYKKPAKKYQKNRLFTTGFYIGKLQESKGQASGLNPQRIGADHPLLIDDDIN
jgi:hypothetical protein